MTSFKRLILCALLALLVPTGTARADDPPSTYVVHACRAGDRPAPLTGWYLPTNGVGVRLVNRCAEGGPFGMEFARGPVAPNDGLSFAWNAPKDSTVVGMRLWRTAILGSLSYRFDGGTVTGIGTPNLAVDGPYTFDAGAAVARAEFTEIRNIRAAILNPTVWCASTSAPCAGQFFHFSRVELVVLDQVPAQAEGTVSGSLLAAGPLTGPVDIRTGFSDRGGGVAAATLVVDGLERVRVPVGGCVEPFTAPAPCPLSGEAVVPFDTTMLSNGAHKVQLQLVDAARNVTSLGPFPIVVDNPVPPPTPQPFRAGKVVTKRSTVRVSYGGSVKVEGAVVASDGSPIDGVTVTVSSRPNDDTRAFSGMAPVTAGADGRFTIALEPGPSRVIRLRYGDTEALATVLVEAGVRLSVSPKKARNGRSIRFTGSVLGAKVKRVELQAMTKRGWIPFRTTTVRDGRFQARYRFTNTSATTRYRFRAVVRPADDSYLVGRSREVRVTVRP